MHFNSQTFLGTRNNKNTNEYYRSYPLYEYQQVMGGYSVESEEYMEIKVLNESDAEKSGRRGSCNSKFPGTHVFFS